MKGVFVFWFWVAVTIRPVLSDAQKGPDVPLFSYAVTTHYSANLAVTSLFSHRGQSTFAQTSFWIHCSRPSQRVAVGDGLGQLSDLGVVGCVVADPQVDDYAVDGQDRAVREGAAAGRGLIVGHIDSVEHARNRKKA